MLKVQHSKLVLIHKCTAIVLETDIGHERAEAGSEEARVELSGPHVEVVTLPDLSLLQQSYVSSHRSEKHGEDVGSDQEHDHVQLDENPESKDSEVLLSHLNLESEVS